jgi:D-3-phosphoglycerate dehydrogenase/glyoxylate/hydroxypyruvate reductase A
MSILVLATSPIVEAQLAALRRLAPEEVIETDPDRADATAVETILAFRLPAGLVERFPNLRFLAGAGAGVDDLLATPLPARLAVTRANDPAQAVRMAQYVALVVLRWHRDLARYEAQQRRAEWSRSPAETEQAWTVGLMGLGTQGRAVARALVALGYPVRAWTRTPREHPGVTCFATDASLGAFAAGTRVLVCLLPLTPRTRGLLAAPLFAQLPRGAYVVNVARGALLDKADLLAALAAGQLAGAALDVYAREPLAPDDPLWRDGRILATPHIAAIPDPDTAMRQLLDNLALARRGEPLRNLVDRQRGY